MKTKKVIRQVIAPIDCKLTHVEKRNALTGWCLSLMGDRDTRVYVDNIYCSENDLKHFKVREGRRYEKGQVIVEWEEFDE